MKLLLRLYPGWWRRRYGAEALEILESRSVTLSLLWDLVAGAVDAWLNQEMPPKSAGGTPKSEDQAGFLINGDRKRNKRVAGVGLMVLVGAVVFVETYRTIQGHPDGAPGGPVNPLVVVATATAAGGFWFLMTGRRLRGWPRWPFEGRAFRLAGAYCLVGDLLVIALAVTRNDGVAFLIYASLALALAGTTLVVRSPKPGI